MTILEIRKKYFKKIDQLELDWLLEDVLKRPRAFILAHPEKSISNHQLTIINRKIARRVKGEPLAYILGYKNFYGMDFIVNKNVLVPRPETELMVEEALNQLSISNEQFTIIDVGTGSGCIIISLSKKSFDFQHPTFSFIGIDISPKALTVAKKNAKLHEADKKIRFIKGSLLEPILKNKKLIIDDCKLIIAANLPYVESGWKKALKSPERIGLKFEPSIALYSGKDGLDHYRKLAVQIKKLSDKTKKPITLFCEIGPKQAGGMKKIFSFAGKIEIKKDHNCYYRLAIIDF